MLTAFQEFIHNNRLLFREERVLLAVSGGIDSMVMADLFIRSGYNTGIAHCNFSLRGEESDEDERFVQEFSKRNGIPFYGKRFGTESFAREQGISIQMAARTLRYSWFEEVRVSNGYHYICVAHNLDDVIETCFINLSRGTGIRGLSGMKAKNGRIIRPLLFTGRKEIEEYCNANNLRFREDTSNRSVKYSRNRIRHRIIPEFLKIREDFRNIMLTTISCLSGVEGIFMEIVEAKRREVVTEKKGQLLISISGLRDLVPLAPYLYEFLRPFHFPTQVTDNIIRSLDGIPGKQFLSPTHRLIRDRENLIITELSRPDERELYYIEETVLYISYPVNLSFVTETIHHKPEFHPAENRACVDYDLLEFPLILRRWKKGDSFQPLGMDHLKKLSDFFIDNKLSIHEKENTWILESGDKIVWIVGRRIDNRFRITPDTRSMLVVELHDRDYPEEDPVRPGY